MSLKGETKRSRLLIVDDEAEILVALGDLFEDEFDIVATTQPEEALAHLAADRDIAVIVSDQRMPDMTGDAFLSAAQKISDAKGILLTGYADLTAVISALNQGRIQFYVHKPWDSDALKAMVRETARRFHLEKALQTERFLMESTLRAATFDIVFSDAEGRILRHNFGRTNPSLERDLSTSIDLELNPENREEFLYPEGERAAVTAQRLKVMSDEVVETCQQVTRAGVTRWVEQTRLLLPWPRNADGSLRPENERWHATFSRDVTEKRALEQQLRQDDKMRALGTLSGGIAHDFNNLLTAIIGSLDLMEDLIPEQDRADGSMIRRLLDNAVSSARKGASLTKGLLDFGRPKEVALQSIALVPLVINMRALLTQSLSRASDRHSATKRCTLDLSVIEKMPDDIFVMTDPEQLEMALLNLCINARDAMQDGGCVRFDIEHLPGPHGQACAVIHVSDTGHGMTADVASRVFDPFFTTKGVGEGTGLGLSTIYSFLKRSGGDIRIDSKPGFGARISLFIPMAQGGGTPPASQTAPCVALKKALQILLVDDEANVRLVTERFLTREGHYVTSFADGASAVAHLRAGAHYDLAVIDVTMPGMTGVACGDCLRSILPALKIIYISGYSEGVALPTGSNVLSKPYTSATLHGAIAALMG